MCQKLSQLHKTENLYKTFVQSRLKSKYLNLLINQSAASHKLRYLQLKFCAPLALIFFRQLKLMRKHTLIGTFIASQRKRKLLHLMLAESLYTKSRRSNLSLIFINWHSVASISTSKTANFRLRRAFNQFRLRISEWKEKRLLSEL